MLSFDYDSRANHETASYRGFTVRALRDESPSNPFEDWDCEPPLVVAYDRSITEYGDDALEPLTGVSDWWINRKWRAVAVALSLDVAEMESEVADRCKGVPIADARRDYLDSALSDARPSHYGGNAGDYFEAVAALWMLRGVEARADCSTGYSQGDYAECLTVATPAWAEKVGAPRDSHARQLKAAVALYGAWAWGDVYGWEIVSPDGDALESCWGYYGTDHDASGLSEAARGQIDATISVAMRARLDCLKTLIRNRVPTHARPALLASAGAYRGEY